MQEQVNFDCRKCAQVQHSIKQGSADKGNKFVDMNLVCCGNVKPTGAESDETTAGICGQGRFKARTGLCRWMATTSAVIMIHSYVIPTSFVRFLEATRRASILLINELHLYHSCHSVIAIIQFEFPPGSSVSTCQTHSNPCARQFLLLPQEHEIQKSQLSSKEVCSNFSSFSCKVRWQHLAAIYAACGFCHSSLGFRDLTWVILKCIFALWTTERFPVQSKVLSWEHRVTNLN